MSLAVRGDNVTAEYNALSAQIEAQEKEALQLYSRISAIDKIMRENLDVQTALLGHERDTLREYVTQPVEERNWESVKANLERRFTDERAGQLEGLEGVLGARETYVLRGRFVVLTEEAKQEKREAFANILETAIQEHLAFFAQPIVSDLETRITVIETDRATKMASYEQMMDSKTALTNQIYAIQEKVDQLIVQRNGLHQKAGLQQICETGDVDRLRAELSQFFLSRSKKKFADTLIEGTPLIMIATHHHQAAIVDCLIEQEANVEACDLFGYQAIHTAAKNGDEAIAGRLLRKKALIATAKGEYGRTPLHMAAYNGRDTLIPLLLHCGADVNSCTTDEDGKKTPLHDAVIQNHPRVVIALVRHPDLNVNIRDSAGLTPLYHAVADGLTEMMSLIIGHPSFQWAAPGDRNHIASLLQLRPRQNAGQVKELLETFPG
jgi:hypothetical protein